ncbi:hypothetical protein CIB48_g11260 [Xylaria polymorpha]|nr:hypothetical protein CIB48_g11260 [Xylaria polymorpha]
MVLALLYYAFCDEMHAKNDVAVHQCHAGDGDGADMILDLNGKRIAVSFYPSTGLPEGEVKSDQPHACIEDSIIQRLGQAILADVEETVGSTPAIIPIDPSESYTCIKPTFDEDPEGELEMDDSLPQYSSQQITVVETFVQGAGHLVSRVLVNGKEMLCKARSQGLRYSDLEQELGSMQKIREACLHGHTPMHVPALLGYVRHPEAGCVIGFLQKTHVGKANFGDDGKARNVIVDDEDAAWLIDFGGGFTEGWVFQRS